MAPITRWLFQKGGTPCDDGINKNYFVSKKYSDSVLLNVMKWFRHNPVPTIEATYDFTKRNCSRGSAYSLRRAYRMLDRIAITFGVLSQAEGGGDTRG
jgi:hypothetical protein